MKLGLILFLFFILSILLIFVTIEQKAKVIYTQESKNMIIPKVKVLSTKTYKRTRKTYTPQRSLVLAERRIQNILLKSPIDFELNNSTLPMKSTLIQLVKILNHLKEDVALSILAHTDVAGTAKYNLNLSQKKADKLKEYFRAKTNLPLVVAIGYGEAFSLKNRLIEINLKRIKQ